MDDALRIALYSGALEDAEGALGSGGSRLVSLYAFLHGHETTFPNVGSGADGDLAVAEHAALARIELVTLQAVGGCDIDASATNDPWLRATAALQAFLRCEPMPKAGAELSAQPVLRLEEIALRSLQRMDSGEQERATRDARRVTRAAYAESIRLQEFFAYWVLARARRQNGHAHAAARISAALCRSAPTTWRPLLDWELVLAGGDEASIERPLEGPAALWLALRRAVVNGSDRHDKEAAFRSYTLLPRFAKERDALCDGLRALTDVKALRPIAGALSAAAMQLQLTPAIWRVAPGMESRLQWCIAGGSEARSGFREGERIQRALACLAAAYPTGVSPEKLFLQVYGFAMDSEEHKSMLRVLVHRVRGALTGGSVERGDDGYRIECSAPLLLPEPASAPPFGDQILRAIALRPGISAGVLAEELGKNVRSVQRALRLLDETGACVGTRIGRATTYTLEDTTFSEPTHFGQVIQ